VERSHRETVLPAPLGQRALAESWDPFLLGAASWARASAGLLVYGGRLTVQPYLARPVGPQRADIRASIHPDTVV